MPQSSQATSSDIMMEAQRPPTPPLPEASEACMVCSKRDTIENLETLPQGSHALYYHESCLHPPKSETDTHLPLRQCVICREENTVDNLIRLNCEHTYHEGCLKPWWESQPPRSRFHADFFHDAAFNPAAPPPLPTFPPETFPAIHQPVASPLPTTAPTTATDAPTNETANPHQTANPQAGLFFTDMDTDTETDTDMEMDPEIDTDMELLSNADDAVVNDAMIMGAAPITTQPAEESLAGAMATLGAGHAAHGRRQPSRRKLVCCYCTQTATRFTWTCDRGHSHTEDLVDFKAQLDEKAKRECGLCQEGLLNNSFLRRWVDAAAVNVLDFLDDEEQLDFDTSPILPASRGEWLRRHFRDLTKARFAWIVNERLLNPGRTLKPENIRGFFRLSDAGAEYVAEDITLGWVALEARLKKHQQYRSKASRMESGDWVAEAAEMDPAEEAGEIRALFRQLWAQIAELQDAPREDVAMEARLIHFRWISLAENMSKDDWASLG